MFNWQSTLFKRVIIGLAILGVIAVVFAFRLLTVFIFDVFVIVIAWFACYEIMKARKMEDKGVRDFYLYPFITLAYLLFLLGILIETPFTFWLHVILQIVLVFILCVYVYFMALTDKTFEKQCKLKKIDHKKESWRVVVRYLGILLYPAFLVFTLIPLNHMGRWAEVTLEGQALPEAVTQLGLLALLLVFGISMMSDTFAYCVGRVVKGKKLCPNISPNKTVSGAIAGLFGGVIAALIITMIMSTNDHVQQFLTDTIGYASSVIWVMILIGLLGSALTQIGDIYASMIKRRNDIKDFGKFMPGHGGMMDRIDGLIFNSAFIFVFFMILIAIH
ncbi:MAG: phosphatidate cytidylyltransferase [Firmicutes bacterium]|nr:phosphatidate cytidylyltransferase [Bacillota bacterium]